MAVPSKSFSAPTDAEIDPDSAITTSLHTKHRDNAVHLEEWLGDSFTAAKDHDHDGVNSKIVSGADFIEIERKIITADTNLVTFSSLSGETDEIYKMIMRIRTPILSGGQLVKFFVNPNGITANQSSTTSEARLHLGNQGVQATIGNIMFEVLFHARHTVNSQANFRLMNSQNTVRLPLTTGVVGSLWDDTSTTITSLEVESVVTAGPTNGMLDGSTIALYRLRQ